MIGIQSDSRSGSDAAHIGAALRAKKQRFVWCDPLLMSQLLLLAAYTMPVGMILWRSGGPTGKVGVAYQLNRGKLRQVRRRESRYLLHTNLSGKDPVQLWKFYIQLVEIDIDQSWRLSRLTCWRGGARTGKQAVTERKRRCSSGLEVGDGGRVRRHQLGGAPLNFEQAAA